MAQPTLDPKTDSHSSPEKTATLDAFEGPAWNNATEYPSRTSNEFVHDRATAEMLVSQIREILDLAKPQFVRADLGKLPEDEQTKLVSELQASSELAEQAQTVVANLLTYLSCEKCVDGRDTEAHKLYSEIIQISTDLAAVMKPMWLFLSKADDRLVQAYLAHPHTQPEAFMLERMREMADTRLSEAEEIQLVRFGVHGPTAWGELYNQISGQLVCKVGDEEMGLAKASGLLRDASESKRRQAWEAIQSAWKTHENSGAAILNGLAGWRLEEYKRRSHTRKVDFLDFPLHNARIKRETLEAMLEAIRSESEVPRRAMLAMARASGKEKLDAWDILAPAPALGTQESRRTFAEGLGWIRDAFSSVDPSFGDFIATMEKNQWIEGRVLPSKRQGAFCTRFPKSRTPRVFQTFMGSINDIRTLAHELGHAYHSWVMRDLPIAQHRYPMTLAETASIFAEAVFSDHMIEKGDSHTKIEMAWQNGVSAAAFLMNIPARFEFEKSLYERRQKSFVGPDELSELTQCAWEKWYGDSLNSHERQYWITKLHFSMSGVSFYNYPYSFGYLFSLGIYNLRKERGAEFLPSYVRLLRDTGRMTAEELARQHLGEDITKPEYWKKSIQIVRGQVEELEKLLVEREPVRLRQ